MQLLQPSLFCQKFLEPLVESGNLFVLVRKFLFRFGKVTFAEPREYGVPALLRFLYIGLQLGYVFLVPNYLLPVVFRVRLMLGGGADNPTLQPERFHGRCVTVLVFMKPGAPHHIIR